MALGPFLSPSSRRTFVARCLAAPAVLARALAGRSAPGQEMPALIVRSERPLDVETPASVFREYLTPNRLFFIRSHLGMPAVALRPQRLEVRGEVRRARSWTPGELARFEPVTITAVLQCAGNGRSYFEPNIPGVGWDRGAVGNAEWTGVRLRDLLDDCGVKEGAAHVHFLGSDLPPNPKTPVFLRSLDLRKALDPSVIVATKMNGEALPLAQGGPLRLVVPGWTGNHWMKWLREIRVETAMAPGFYMQTAYRIPKAPVPPGADVKPEDLDYVTRLNVKSLIASPGQDAVLTPGRHEIRGVAWTGPGRVTKVEVATTPGGPWAEAEFVGPDREFAWRSWRYEWAPDRPGAYLLQSRATDSTGDVQPEKTPWNRSGYLWNAIDRIPCEVRA